MINVLIINSYYDSIKACSWKLEFTNCLLKMFLKVVPFLLFAVIFSSSTGSDLRNCPVNSRGDGCPPNSEFGFGNACSDMCGKEAAKCTTEKKWRCICIGEFRLNPSIIVKNRKKGPYCIPYFECPNYQLVKSSPYNSSLV